MKRPAALLSIMFTLVVTTMIVIATGKNELKSVDVTNIIQEKEDIAKIFAVEGAEGPTGNWW